MSNSAPRWNRRLAVDELIERLRNFEGSDALGNGDFSLMHEAAAALATAKPKETDVNEEQRKSFEAAARPLIQWLNDNVNPHHTVIVTPTNAELLAGECTTGHILDYMKD